MMMWCVFSSILLGTISTSINLDYDIVEICFICVEVPINLEDGPAARAAAAAPQLAEAAGGAEVGVHGEERATHGHGHGRVDRSLLLELEPWDVKVWLTLGRYKDQYFSS